MTPVRRKIVMYIIAFLFSAGGLFLFFNDSGVLKYMKLQNQVNDLTEQIKQMEDENKRLQNEIDSLKQNIPAKIEKVAREKYNMIREGEKAIKMVPQK